MRAYDNTGNPVATEVNYAGKAVRKEWQELNVKYVAKKDGYFDVDVVNQGQPNIKTQLNLLRKWTFSQRNPKDNTQDNTPDPGTSVNIVCYDCGGGDNGGGDGGYSGQGTEWVSTGDPGGSTSSGGSGFGGAWVSENPGIGGEPQAL